MNRPIIRASSLDEPGQPNVEAAASGLMNERQRPRPLVGSHRHDHSAGLCRRYLSDNVVSPTLIEYGAERVAPAGRLSVRPRFAGWLAAREGHDSSEADSTFAMSGPASARDRSITSTSIICPHRTTVGEPRRYRATSPIGVHLSHAPSSRAAAWDDEGKHRPPARESFEMREEERPWAAWAGILCVRKELCQRVRAPAIRALRPCADCRSRRGVGDSGRCSSRPWLAE